MWCVKAAAVAAVTIGEGCVRIWVAATDDDGGRPMMTGGWDDDGRWDVSAVVAASVAASVTASIHRACERGAIGGGGHDDAACSGWVVVLGEHDEDQPLWRRGGLLSLIYLAKGCVYGDDNGITSLSGCP